MSSMVNRWNYGGLGKVSYGHIASYTAAADYLDGFGETLEDWGCGCAAMRSFVNQSRYLGLDGSQNEYADVCGVDLAHYQSATDCLLLRDVLDHNLEWKVVLQNALASFQKRMVLIFFMPFGPETKVVNVNQLPKYQGVPDIQFARSDILPLIQPYLVAEQAVGDETLFFLQKEPNCRRIISFSLFGPDEMYWRGAKRNVDLAAEVYPGWQCRFYVDDLARAAALAAMGVEIEAGPPEIPGKLWRHCISDDRSVHRYLVRDADSRISEREAVAVREWTESGLPFHVMRDYSGHSDWPVMAGMYGAVNGFVPGFAASLLEEARRNPADAQKKIYDLPLLSQLLWPRIWNLCYQHDAFPNGKFGAVHALAPRIGARFIGEIIKADDVPLYGDQTLEPPCENEKPETTTPSPAAGSCDGLTGEATAGSPATTIR